MSGSHELEPLPPNNTEWARQVQQRLRRLETPRSFRAGAWTITEHNGDLVATRPGVPPIPLAAFAAQPDSGGSAIDRLPLVMPSNWIDGIVQAITGAKGTLDDLGQWLSDMWNSFLTPKSPLDASNLFGQLGAWLFGQVPSTAITDGSANPLWNPNFRAAISMAPGSGWEWDGEVYFNDPDDALSTDEPGCAKCTADGTVHAMYSNRFAVQPNQSVPLDIKVLTDQLVCTGKPIRVDIIELFVDATDNETRLGIVSVPGMSMGAATDDPDDWVNAPATAKQARLIGSYSPPTDGSVNQIRLRPVVDAGASSGTVRFDKAAVTLTGGLLADLKSEQLAKQEAWRDFFQAGWNVLTNQSLSFPQKIAALQAAWDDFAAEIADIQADQTLTIQKILNQFFPGLFPDGENPTGLQAAQAFFDNVRRSMNQMIQGWGWGYFDANWQWVPSLTTPAAQLPGGNPAMTPGRNDDDTPPISSGADPTIPGAPTGAVAFPVWDLSVTGFPAGNITYAIAAVRNGIEGPAVMVKAFAGTLSPPNTNGRMDLSYTAPAGGADSYRIYRRVDDTYTAALDWRLVATPTHDYPWLLSQPLSDKTIRSGGTVAHPKTDSELSAQIVTDVRTTAVTAETNNQALVDTIVQVGTGTTDTDHTTEDAGSALANWPGDNVSGPVGMTSNLTFSQILDQLVSGFTATAATDTTPTDAGAAANDLNQRANLAGTLSLMALRENHSPRPWRDGGDTSAEVSLPLVFATQLIRYAGGNATGVMVTPNLGGPKDQIQIGFIQRPTTLTSVYVALYQLQTDGLFHRIFLSDNIATLIANNGTTSDNNIATLVSIPLGTVLQTSPGQAYYVEVINKSPSSVNASLLCGNQLVRDPGWHLLPAYVRTDAATVTAPTTLAWTSGTYFSSGALFFATLRYSNGATAVEADDTQLFDTPGTFTWYPPDWWRPGVDFVDVIPLGAGGSGGIGIAGGGKPGQASSVTVPGPGGRTVTGPGGAAGVAGIASASGATGKSPGRTVLNGHLYVGGDPASVVLGIASAGKPPGGGSSGAQWSGAYGYGGGAGGWDSGTFQPNVTSLTGTVGAGGAGVSGGSYGSLAGGRGAVWITARQNRNA